MTRRLENKVAVITGGGNGIGRACAERFAAEGAAVVIGDLQEERAAEVVGAITGAGGRATFVRLDASSRVDNETLADEALRAFGGIDVLLTAAGVSHSEYRSGDTENELKLATKRHTTALEAPWRAFIELETIDFERVIQVNVTGTLLAMQACAARMVEAKRSGSFITIASIAAKHPDAGPLPYVVSKAGVWMMTKKAARELAGIGIRVNAIGPGFIETNMTQVIGMLPEERRQTLNAAIPLGRLGQPHEVANVALFLASDEASYVTGTIMHPDGGYFTD